MPFLPVFTFTSAELFIQMHRVTYQRQLANGGILLKVDDTQVPQQILRNTFTCLHFQVQNRFERLYVLNLHLKSHDLHLVAKPDLAITEPRKTFSALDPDIPLNPVVIIEVLSQDDEREQKFKQYREIASLREYVRIETAQYLVEHFVKHEGWKCTQTKNWEAKVSLKSIDANFSLAAVYYQVKIGTDL